MAETTKELDGRVAIVTGAGRNIGRAIALALARGGAAVVVNARTNRKEAEAVALEIETGGGRALPYLADVTDAAAVAAMVAAARARFGHIEILVNNAAVRDERPIDKMTTSAPIAKSRHADPGELEMADVSGAGGSSPGSSTGARKR